MTNLAITATPPSVGPFSVECPNLLQHHLGHLRGSGISDEVIRERGYESVLGKKRLADLGCSSAQQRTPGIIIPLYAPDSSPAGYQYRPDNPRIRDGKIIKYDRIAFRGAPHVGKNTPTKPVIFLLLTGYSGWLGCT